MRTSVLRCGNCGSLDEDDYASYCFPSFEVIFDFLPSRPELKRSRDWREDKVVGPRAPIKL